MLTKVNITVKTRAYCEANFSSKATLNQSTDSASGLRGSPASFSKFRVENRGTERCATAHHTHWQFEFVAHLRKHGNCAQRATGNPFRTRHSYPGPRKQKGRPRGRGRGGRGRGRGLGTPTSQHASQGWRWR